MIDKSDNRSGDVRAGLRSLVQSTIALAVAAVAALAASGTAADAAARDITTLSFGFADSLWTRPGTERPGTPSLSGGVAANPCWVRCGTVLGTPVVRRSDWLTSNNGDLSARKIAAANARQMGMGGMIVVERLESDASGSLTNWVVVSERIVDEDGSHSWSRLSGVPSDALWRPNDLYRFEGSSFSMDLAAVGTTGATPEPSTWLMLLIGFAGLGVAGYRSSRLSLVRSQFPRRLSSR